MTSRAYWLPANSGILGLRHLRLGWTTRFKHAQHAVGDEESADHVTGRSDDGNHAQNSRERTLLLADKNDRADHRDRVERVRERHQWRVQQRRDVADHFESDKGRQHENEKCINEVGRHQSLGYVIGPSSGRLATVYAASTPLRM